MKVAILQYRVPASYEEAVAKAISYVEQAAAQGADVVLLPELFEGPYFCQIEDYENFKKAEVRKTSKTLATFQAVAKKNRVVLPVSFFEKDGNCYFNSLEMFDKDGRDLGLYRKSHIPTGECYEEKFYFAPGNTGFKVFKTDILERDGVVWSVVWLKKRVLTLLCCNTFIHTDVSLCF